MLNRLPLSELTSRQIFAQAVKFADRAERAKSDYLRGAFGWVAIRYARLAAEREAEESVPASSAGSDRVP